MENTKWEIPKKINKYSRNKKLEKKKDKICKSLKENATNPELKLKKLLEDAGVSFEFQKPININFIKFIVVDFVIGNTIIEIDGSQHFSDSKMKSDKERDKILKQRGYKIVRLSNYYIDKLDSKSIYTLLNTKLGRSKPKLKQLELKDSLKFGKYKGKTVENLMLEDKQYLIWMFRTEICTFPKEVLKELNLK